MNFILVHFLLFIFIVSCLNFCQSTNASDGSIRINKCCEPHEILVDLRCTDVNDTKTKEGIVLALYAFREIFFLVLFVFLIFSSSIRFSQSLGHQYLLEPMACKIFKCQAFGLLLEYHSVDKNKCGRFIIIQL